MNECTSSRQQLANIYKQLNNEVVSGLKEWLEQNQTLYQKISDCCEDANSNLSDINDILDEYIEILVDCCGGINGKLNLILTGIEDICIECVHVPVTPTTTEEHTQTTTAEPTPVTTGEPGPEECDSPTEVHEKGSFYPYGPITKYLGEEEGLVTLDYEVYKIPDRFVVFWNGEKVIDTGYHGLEKFEPMLNDVLVNEWGEDPVSIDPSMTGSVTFYKDKPDPYALILVYAPLRNTAFNFILSCPYNTTTSSTTSTTTEEEFTSTSSEETDTTTARPCTLDIEVLFPPQPVATTTSTEEPATTTSSTTAEPGTTTSTTCGCPEESCGYGLLYNQLAVQDERNIANTGWHVPTYEEAKEMLIAYGGSEYVEGEYKDTGIEPNGELQFMDTDPEYWFEGATGTNTTCFSARGNSYRYAPDGEFYSLNDWATWWLAESGYWIGLEPTVRFSAGNYYTGASNTGMGLRLVMDNPEEWYCGMLYTGNNGDTYSTVKIGDQVWLGENLRETEYRTGANIAEITDNAEWVAATEGALCAYDNDWLENICTNRPCDLPDNYTSEFILFGSISFTGGPPFTSFIATLEDACQAIYDHAYNGGTIQANYDPAVSGYYSAEDFWRVDDLVYNVATCELVATGYYIMYIQGTGNKIVHIVDGVIVSYPVCPETTTTSTTEEPETTTTTEYVPDAFIFEIEAGAETIELPLHTKDDDGNVATYDAVVYWDWENHPEESEPLTTASASHAYSAAGTYVVVIEGTCQTFATRSKTDTATHSIASKIKRVLKWGNVADFRLLNFYGCVNMTDLPHDIAGNPYGSSEGVITCASNINTFENFIWTCVAYTHGINSRLFENCASVASFKNTFAYSGVTGNIPSLLFDYNPDVTTFEGTFRDTNLGNGGYSLDGYLFWNNTLATNFAYTFYNTKFTTPIPGSIFTQNTLAENFSYTFGHSNGYGVSPYSDGNHSPYWAGAVPSTLFTSNGEALYFDGTFYWSGIISNSTNPLPPYLFWNNPKAISFYRTFSMCFNLQTNVLTTNLFKKNVLAENMGYTFEKCEHLTDSIPAGLFVENKEVTSFAGVFGGGGNVYGHLSGAIPSTLFDTNTKVVSFGLAFRRQVDLTLAPNGLFKNNKLATQFYRVFETCIGMYIEQYVFSSMTGDPVANAFSRFSGKSGLDFRWAFLCSSDGDSNYPPTNSRYAPELWDNAVYDYVSCTLYTECFKDVKSSSGRIIYTNYCDVPATWGGGEYEECESTTTTTPTP